MKCGWSLYKSVKQPLPVWVGGSCQKFHYLWVLKVLQKKKLSSLWVMGLIWVRDTQMWDICMLFALQQLRVTMKGRNMCQWDCGSLSTAVGTIGLSLNITPDTGCNPHRRLWDYFHIQMSRRRGICIRQQTPVFNSLKQREKRDALSQNSERTIDWTTDRSITTDRQNNRQTDRSQQTDRSITTDRQNNRQTDRSRLIDRTTDRQIDHNRQTDRSRLIDRTTDRQIDHDW